MLCGEVWCSADIINRPVDKNAISKIAFWAWLISPAADGVKKKFDL